MAGETVTGQTPPLPSHPIPSDLPRGYHHLSLADLRRIFFERHGLDEFRQITVGAPETIPLRSGQMFLLGQAVPMMIAPRSSFDTKQLIDQSQFYVVCADTRGRQARVAVRPLEPGREYTVGRGGDIDPTQFDTTQPLAIARHQCTVKINVPPEGEDASVLEVNDPGSKNGTYILLEGPPPQT